MKPNICTIWKATLGFAVCTGIGVVIGLVSWLGVEMFSALKTFL